MAEIYVETEQGNKIYHAGPGKLMTHGALDSSDQILPVNSLRTGFFINNLWSQKEPSLAIQIKTMIKILGFASRLLGFKYATHHLLVL